MPAIKAQDGMRDWNIIERLLKEWQPDEVIVGLPLNMDGTEQPLTARARKVANRIHGRFGVEGKSMTSVLAPWKPFGLFEQGGYRALNKGKVDLPLRLLFFKVISSRDIKAILKPCG
ncbi:Holliday junction resolvase RuvX [Shigella flexneri]